MKRARGRGSSQDSSGSSSASGRGHTPKWTRSSTSPSPSTEPQQDNKDLSKDTQNQSMQCVLPGHAPLTFTSTTDFEVHYAKDHNNQCVACKAILPSSLILKLHQDENHDPLIRAQRDNGEKTYRCFEQDCEKVTLTPQKRRLHLIDKHGYPKDYDFRIVDSGSRGKRSLLRDQNHNHQPSQQKRRVSNVGEPGWRDRIAAIPEQSSLPETQPPFESKDNLKYVQSPATETSPATKSTHISRVVPTESLPDSAVESLSTTLSSLSFVPLSVRLKNKKKT